MRSLFFVALSALLAACGAPPASETETTENVGRPAQVASGATSALGAPTSVRELCLPSVPPFAASAAPQDCARADVLDDALTAVALDRCSFGANAKSGLAAPSALRPRFLAGALASPLAFAASGRALGAALDEGAASSAPVSRAIALARAAGAAPQPGGCFTMTEEPLADALRDHALVAPADQKKADAALAEVPAALGQAIAPIVLALADAEREIAAALPADATSRASLENTVDFVLWSAPRAPGDSDVAIAAKVDVDRIARAAERVAMAVESAKLARFAGAAVPDVVVPTTIGDIVLRGPNADDDDGTMSHVALWIDTGGDDVHRGTAGAATKAQPASVLIDLGGSDRYGYVEKDAGTKTRLPADAAGRLASGRTASRVPRQGGALFGVGLTFDFGAGSDRYRTLAIGQGAGAFGVGVLYDEGGSDDFAAETFAQGAGIAGIGLLVDGAGNDARTLFARGQGYGALSGVGILADASGDDAYRADPGDPRLGGELLYPSDLLSGPPAKVLGNHNAAQGCGEGRRGVSGASAIAAGGLGVLRDASGNDRYRAGAFAEGCGLEEGAGFLLDGAGSDRYDALAYVQGAGIHRAFGALVDDSGDDAFNATFPIQATSVGVGHDYGAGVFFDLGGKDDVHAPTLSLGSGSANGVGLFVALGGDDAFAAATKASFGAGLANGVSAARQREITAGVFVKAAGHAVYRIGGKSMPYAGTMWHDDDASPKTMQKGVGLDAPAGKVGL